MIALAALLLAANQPPPTPGWLAGHWVRVTDSAAADPERCIAEESKSWHGDGSYDDAYAAGSWRLNGTRLTEIANDGEPATSTVRRLGPNRLQVTDADGEKTWLARCRR